MDISKAEEGVSLFGAVSRNRKEDEGNADAISVTAMGELPHRKVPKGNKPPENGSSKPAESEAVKKMSGIESAKDRAQITSATAMSIVHVALLKSVLDLGVDNDPYYRYRLGFILAALVLQIIAGFIALYVALLRGYYTKYRDDFMNDCVKTCFPWTCRRKKKQQRHTTTTAKKTRSVSAMEQECDEDPSCCPFECTTQGYYHWEYEILDMFENISEQVIRSDIDAASTETDIKWFSGKVDSLKEKMESYKEANDEESIAKLASINAEMEEAMKRKEEFERMRQTADSFLAKGVAIEKHVQRINEQHVLKRVTFWQNLLNMVFYVVFVLNAIIAGLGLADPGSTVAGGGVQGATTLGEATATVAVATTLSA